jgi:hypothetical protein
MRRSGWSGLHRLRRLGVYERPARPLAQIPRHSPALLAILKSAPDFTAPPSDDPNVAGLATHNVLGGPVGDVVARAGPAPRLRELPATDLTLRGLPPSASTATPLTSKSRTELFTNAAEVGRSGTRTRPYTRAVVRPVFWLHMVSARREVRTGRTGRLLGSCARSPPAAACGLPGSL